MMTTLNEEQQQIINTVRRFIEREVKPVASDMEHRDEYPHALVERMKELALSGRGLSTFISRHVKNRYESRRHKDDAAASLQVP